METYKELMKLKCFSTLEERKYTKQNEVKSTGKISHSNSDLCMLICLSTSEVILRNANNNI